MKSHPVFGLAFACALGLVATEAQAVVLAQVGTHPTYGNGYAAFWAVGAIHYDYAMLTNATNTYVNAPSASGTIFFRGANGGTNGAPDPDGWYSRMYLDSQSNLHVGNTISSPMAAFSGNPQAGGASIDAYASSQAGIAVYAHSDSSIGFGVYGYAPGGGTAVRALSIGGVGLDASGSTAVRASGDVTISSQSGVGGNLTLWNGQAYKPGGGQFAAVSDERVKQDVVDFKAGLDALEKIRVVKYQYNGLGGTEKNGKEYVGVIAQELEKVSPFMVSTRKAKLRENDKVETDIKQVDPNAFTYMLINSVQQLAQQNAALKKVVCKDHPAEAICGAKKVAVR
jgi:hypothetical protein